MKLSQAERLRRLLSDGQSHSTVEIMEKVYGGSHLGLARVGARIHDLKARGCEIDGWRDAENRAVYWYRLTPRAKPRVEYVMKDGVPHARVIAPPQK